jgi:hypothetical protein
MADWTPQQILAVPVEDSDSAATTIRGYLVALLRELWREQENFSGKRPFGNSGWEFDLHAALVKAHLITGSFDEWGGLEECDEATGDAMIRAAIEYLGVFDD